MSADAFAAECSRIVAERQGDAAHRALDALVTGLLTSLGYGEGMAIFKAGVAAAHSAEAPQPWREEIEAALDSVVQAIRNMPGVRVMVSIDSLRQALQSSDASQAECARLLAENAQFKADREFSRNWAISTWPDVSDEAFKGAQVQEPADNARRQAFMGGAKWARDWLMFYRYGEAAKDQAKATRAVNDRLAALRAENERYGAALDDIIHATEIPPHKRDDTEFLRASCSIALSFARYARTPTKGEPDHG